RLDWSEAPESNLPRALTAFVGRAAELDEARGLLGTSALVTITGPAGVGKSRLAIEVAAQWSGPVVYVPVTGAAGLSELVDAVAAALGIGVSEGRAEDVAVRLRQLPDPLLLIDGFEHLAEHAHILAAWGDARLLVTSRSPLGLAAEARLAVAPLPMADAVALLRDRATSDPDDDEDLRAIVEQLDRMPLALELAAGWLPVLGTAELRRGLERGADVPDDGARTLYTAVARSWDLLDEAAQRGLLRLAAGPWRRSMAEAEALLADGPTPALSILRRLCDAGLVEASGNADGMTYRVYDAVIRFCREQTGFVQQVAAHAQIVSRLGGLELLAGLTGAEASRGYRTIVASREPLAATVRWGLDHDRLDVAVLALDALLVAAEFSGGGAKAIALSSEVLARGELSDAQRAHVYAARWALLGLVSMLELRRRDVAEMGTFDPNAFDEQLRGWVLLRRTSPQERMDTLAADSVASFRQAGALSAMSQARRACAASLGQDGQVRAAERQIRRAVALAREARAPVELGVALIALSAARGGQGYADEAIAFAREAAALLEPCGHRRAAALAWVNLGTLQLMCGQLDRAQTSYQTAMGLYQDLSSPRHVALLHLNLGKTHLSAGRCAEAVQAGQVALRIAEDGNQDPVAAASLQLLAEAEVRQERPLRALGRLHRAIDYGRVPDHIRGLVFATAALAAAKAGSSHEAVAALQDAEGVLHKVQPVYRVQCLTLLCEACVALRDWTMARSLLQRAEAVNAGLTLPDGSLPSRMVDQVRALCGLGDPT
ncbi:MAG: tetratricopeptide repeat protein, partial [Myxococcota bacterium]